MGECVGRQTPGRLISFVKRPQWCCSSEQPAAVGSAAVSAGQQSASTGQPPAPAAATAEQENLFWQSDDEQHEPCGLRGVSVAVPDRCVPSAGAEPTDGASLAGRRGPGSRNRCWRPRVAGAWSPVGRCFRPGLRVGVGWRFAASSWRCVPGLRGVSGVGGDGGRPGHDEPAPRVEGGVTAILRAAAPVDGFGSFAFSNPPIIPFMGPSHRPPPTAPDLAR